VAETPTSRSIRLPLSRTLFRLFGLAGLALVIAWPSGCSGASGIPHDDTASVVAELTRLSDAWDKAIVRKDTAAVAGNMAEDFRQIASNGEVANKEMFVRSITAPDLTIDPYTVEDFDVRVYGNVALLSGRTRMTGREGGTPFTTHYRYIDVYVRTNGTWKVCSVQTTRMPA
jgi:ketosteroid isomerase-like protein